MTVHQIIYRLDYVSTRINDCASDIDQYIELLDDEKADRLMTITQSIYQSAEALDTLIGELEQ